jgi:two-component system, cell cycle sensor histidine kinase and response regulator CckA
MYTKQLLEAIVESASQGIIAVNHRGVIIFANQASAQMFGYETKELIGASFEILLPESIREAHRQHFQRYTSAPTVRPMGIGMDLSARRRDGKEFPVEVSLSYVETESGVIGIALVSDITPRKHFEEQVARSQKMEVVGRLAGGIAHDFNNMLTIILGYDRLLLQRLSPLDSLRGYAEEISRAAERAGALTRHLLAFSKQQRFHREVLDLNGLITESIRLLSVAIGQNIRVAADLDPQLGLTSIDKEQMHQLLANLVINARDAMPAGGLITIKTSNVELAEQYLRSHMGVYPGPYVLLSVTDNGTGMDAETKEHIFEPFFTTKGPDKGTGLGLTTVWATVKNFGGEIWVYSEVGKGTIFKIYLPQVNATGTRLDESPLALIQRGGETILIVEDEPGVRKLTAELIGSNGYKILSAADPLQAIQIASQFSEPIHLLLTDVIMPTMSGFELAERFRVLRPEAKVLFMSGYAESSPLLEKHNLPPEHFLRKPFTFEDLMSRIRAAISHGDCPQ